MLTNILEKLVQKGVVTYSNVRGFSDKEIMELEACLKYPLPLVYREFLKTMGHRAGVFFIGTDMFFDDYHDLLALRKTAEELLHEDNYPFRLPDDAFVFSMHQGYQFMYFQMQDSGDDPPVYYYKELTDAPQKISSSLSAYLSRSVDETVLVRKMIK